MRPCEDIFYKLEIGCATAREQKQCPVRKIKRASGAKLYQVGWHFLGEGTMRNEEVNARPPVSRHCRKSVETNQAMDYKQHFILHTLRLHFRVASNLFIRLGAIKILSSYYFQYSESISVS